MNPLNRATKKRKPARARSCSVRLHASTFVLLAKLHDKITQGGWSAVGSKRSDTPTIGAVIHEALSRLA